MPIFESPDGGNTVYSREHRSDQRELIRMPDTRTHDGRSLHDHIVESKLWGNIRRAAETNPALQDAPERAIMIYHLTRTK
jgi:hypothetical protein